MGIRDAVKQAVALKSGTRLATKDQTLYHRNVSATVEAIYENGVLKLPGPLPLKENSRVLVTIQSPEGSAGADERNAWLQVSEAALSATWNNPSDDIFNELLDR